MTHPWIFVRQDSCAGDWDGGLQSALGGDGNLPAPLEIVRFAARRDAPNGKLGVLLEDALLFPLKITLEERAPRAELQRFLAWKLKRYLPFSADHAVIRWVDLPEENTYLTFSLPGSWPEKLVDGFAEEGRHCGYIGGAFTTLLENVTTFRERRSVGLFDDFYVTAALDKQGRYTDFRLRRLPLTDDALDVETLVSDWQQAAATGPILLCDLRERVTDEPIATMKRLGLEVESPVIDGPVLDRLMHLMGDAR